MDDIKVIANKELEVFGCEPDVIQYLMKIKRSLLIF